MIPLEFWFNAWAWVNKNVQNNLSIRESMFTVGRTGPGKTEQILEHQILIDRKF